MLFHCHPVYSALVVYVSLCTSVARVLTSNGTTPNVPFFFIIISRQRRGYSSGSGAQNTEPPSAETVEGWEMIDGGGGGLQKTKADWEGDDGGSGGGGGSGSRPDPREYATGSTEPASSSRTLRVTSSCSLPVTVFSTLSPVSSSASDDYLSEDGGREGGGGEGGGGAPSPGTLSQLAMVKGQLTDALRALAVSFGQVGYCQGEGTMCGVALFLCARC